MPTPWPPRMMPRTFYDVKDGYWRQSRGHVLQWGEGGFLILRADLENEEGRANSRTHVGVVVDFGGGLSGDLSLGGDGTGHALHLRSGGWYGKKV